jgi:threonine synthase
MGHVLGMRCRECGAEYKKQPVHVCELCFGPLEIAYDFAAIKKLFRAKRSRPVRARCGATPIFAD